MFLTQNLMRNQNLKEKIQNIFLEKSYEQILKYADNVDFDVFSIKKIFENLFQFVVIYEKGQGFVKTSAKDVH